MVTVAFAFAVTTVGLESIAVVLALTPAVPAFVVLAGLPPVLLLVAAWPVVEVPPVVVVLPPVVVELPPVVVELPPVVVVVVPVVPPTLTPVGPAVQAAPAAGLKSVKTLIPGLPLNRVPRFSARRFTQSAASESVISTPACPFGPVVS